MNQSANNSTTRNFAASIFWVFTFLILLATASAHAEQSVTVAWTPSTAPNVAGYMIYYGPASRAYTNSITTGNVTSQAISGLADGTAYYFAATTYDAAGNQSSYSPEVNFVTPTPVITNTVPVLTNNVPVLTNTVPVLTNTVPVTTNLSLPTLDAIANLSLRANNNLRSVVLTGLSAGRNSGRAIQVTATSSNPGLIPNPVVQLSSQGNAATLIFQTVPNAVGTVALTVTVANADNNTFSRSFTVTLTPQVTSNVRVPVFFRRPASTLAVAGRAIVLSAGATGSGDLKYSWQFNGRTIPGATSSTLALNKISTAQAGVYTVTVSNQFGSANSRAAVVVQESATETRDSLTRAAGNFGGNYLAQSGSGSMN